MSTTDRYLFDDQAVRENYLNHYDTLRGKVRTHIVRRHLEHLTDIRRRSLRVLDVGCGDGRDCLWLAGLGHDVIGVDTSAEMLREAELQLREPTAGSAEFRVGDVAQALQDYGEGFFDLVISHGVIMYEPDPADFVAAHVKLLRRGGTLSLLAKNVDGLAHRAAREASVDEAIKLLDDSSSLGHLGVQVGAQSIQELSDLGFDAGASVRSWAGVRVFADAPTDRLLDAEASKVLELEWIAARRDPHRRTAALLHVLLMRGIDLNRLPA